MQLKKNKKRKLIILGICLLLIIGYMGFSAYKTKMIYAFNQGYNKGVTDTIIKVYQETESCEPVPIFVGDNNKEIIDASCP